MRHALVLGSEGQDGHYACRDLLKRGGRVTGCDLAPDSEIQESEHYTYQQVDLCDQQQLTHLLGQSAPDLIVHLAAVHLSAGGSYEELFADMVAVNTLSLHPILEYMRSASEAGLLYASSIKTLGSPLPGVIDETTPRKSQCLYSITKNAAHDLIEYYRVNHGVRASVLTLCNHESVRRPDNFFIPKLAAALRRCIDGAGSGHGSGQVFGSLDFFCDWGSAEEYMGIALDLAEASLGEDVIIGSGASQHARELAETICARYGRELQDVIAEASEAPGQQNESYLVDQARLRSLVGRVPEISIDEILMELIDRPVPRDE